MDYGKELKARRLKAGISQAELARRISRNRATISMLEGGNMKANPTLKSMIDRALAGQVMKTGAITRRRKGFHCRESASLEWGRDPRVDWDALERAKEAYL